MTCTWPLQPGPAPIPMVGMRRRSVIAVASWAGHELEHDRERPRLLDRQRVGEEARVPARGPCPGPGPCRPARAGACGVQPMWPITGMPAATIASMTRERADAPLELHGLGAAPRA